MTFSIVARDPQTGMLGVAVTTKFFGVGSLCPFARAGVVLEHPRQATRVVLCSTRQPQRRARSGLSVGAMSFAKKAVR